jgi:glycerol-3-phosphate acyltransferase PlsY
MEIDVAVTVLFGYLIGSIPVAHLVARQVAEVDVRTAGEGNVGARNVFHVVGPRWGIVTFLGDFAKGAVVAAVFLGSPSWRLAVAGAAVLVGHAFPVWLGFVGGKGLSTVGGFAAVLLPLGATVGGLAAAAVWAGTRRFLPTLVTVIVVAIVVAPLTGTALSTVAVVVVLFCLTGVKRALDEQRMREVEAETGWNRVWGLRP